ncbi:adenosylcobinamide-phosphate synthase CbiB [Butyrivibrio sp. INlla14]|uniref:adenosylcobinamide-phosphate synthase CbiB n=1 Tax=Butyrivibrio sp. INlla14 TaxID=1520808 RepID=UPI000876A9AC|nr:adenosylcobinamide-phosphate synthase CbiB [Butyrivibrio sp. INlla14]SCY02331.1 adenosylcobinamide-phosphate synthase [Butyrivibrio sp. INlla14]
MFFHSIAFCLGFVLDQIIGDPYNIPHPIRLIGNLINFLDKKLLEPKDYGNQEENCREKSVRNPQREVLMGLMMWFIVVLCTIGASYILLFVSYKVHVVLGIIVEAVMTCYILAAKSLRVESMKVYKALREGALQDARQAVSMIVGRDTKILDETGVAKAAVETVAENTSDGVIAPLLYTFIGGPVLGFFYKAVNTMDSMVGYHNDRYEYFGRAAAKMDDFFNYVPARLSAFFMIAAAFLCGRDFSGKRAFAIFKRDRYNHKSPNSAQTESVCAGALGVRLAGDASYFGKIVHKPFIGDDFRPVEAEDIKRANRLMYGTTYLCMTVLLILMILLNMIRV